MKIIFNARDIIEAHIVSGMLNANGIDTYVGGYYLQGGIGEACGFDFANIQVADEDYQSAATIVSEYENTPGRLSETKPINPDDICTANWQDESLMTNSGIVNKNPILKRYYSLD